MNQYEWKRQARRLMVSQEKFVSMMYLQYEHIDALIQYMQGFRDYMGGFRETFGSMKDVFASLHDAMREQSKIITQLDETLTAMKKVMTENYHSTDVNNERMEKLLAKVEAYFGTTGLDYDN
jgi:hypothetical protein